MKNNKLSIIVLLISIFTIIAIAAFYNGHKNIDDLVVSEKKLKEIVKGKDVIEYEIEVRIDNMPLQYDATSNIYYCSLSDVDYDKYSPKITCELGYDIAVSSSLTSSTIENNHLIQLIIYDDKTYKEINVIFTILPIISIDLEGNQINSNKRDCEICVYDNRLCADINEAVYKGKIKYRGGSTRKYDKKSFTLSIDSHGSNGKIKASAKNTNLLGVRNGTDYILYAGYNDQEKIRNVFSSNLWFDSCANNNGLNITNGTKYEYVELFVNNQYWGLYALGYPIDEVLMEINNNNDEIENIYKFKRWVSEKQITAEDGAYLPIDGCEIKTDNENWSSLYDYYKNINDIEKAIEMVDIDNSIDFYLFCVLIQHVDGPQSNSIKNAYLTIKKNQDKSIALFCPWDMDITWGNLWSSDAPNYTLEYVVGYEANISFYNNAINRLVTKNDSETINKVLDRYRYLRNNEWSNENITQLLSEYEKLIYNSGAYLREMHRWPDGTYQNPDLKLSRFKEHVMLRLKVFDSLITNYFGEY